MAVMLIVKMPDGNDCMVTDMAHDQWDTIGMLIFPLLYNREIAKLTVKAFANSININCNGLKLAKQIYINNRQYTEAANISQLLEFKDQHDCLEHGLAVVVETDSSKPSSDFLNTKVCCTYNNEQFEMEVEPSKLEHFFNQKVTEGEYSIRIGSTIVQGTTLVISLHRTSNDSWVSATLNDETYIPLDNYHITV